MKGAIQIKFFIIIYFIFVSELKQNVKKKRSLLVYRTKLITGLYRSRLRDSISATTLIQPKHCFIKIATWLKPKLPTVSSSWRSHHQWCEVTKYIHSSIVLQSILNLSISVLCYFTLTLCYISERNILLSATLNLFYSYLHTQSLVTLMVKILHNG